MQIERILFCASMTVQTNVLQTEKSFQIRHLLQRGERQKQEQRKWSVNHLEIVEIVLDNVIKLISLKYFSSK